MLKRQKRRRTKLRERRRRSGEGCYAAFDILSRCFSHKLGLTRNEDHTIHGTQAPVVLTNLTGIPYLATDHALQRNSPRTLADSKELEISNVPKGWHCEDLKHGLTRLFAHIAYTAANTGLLHSHVMRFETGLNPSYTATE